MKHKHFRYARTAAAVSVALGVALGPIVGAGAADAHVTARATGLNSAGFGVVTFVVPNESDTAATTELTVTFPAVKHLMPEGKPGWTAHVTKDGDGAVTAIRWTALPGTPGVPVGEFSEFNVAGGPFTGDVTLPAVQRYADGETVAWDQAGKHGDEHGGAEPERPAPTISAAQAPASTSSEHAAWWLGGLGVLLGAIGIGIGVAGRLRGGEDAAATTVIEEAKDA